MTCLKADEDLDLQNDPMSYRRKGDAMLFASYRLLLVLLQNTEQTWCIGFSLSGNIPYVTSIASDDLIVILWPVPSINKRT